MGQAKRHANKIRLKAVGDGIFGLFSNFDKCRQEVADDIIFGVDKEYVGMDIRVLFGDSTLNSDQITRLVAGCSRFTHFCAVVSCILQPSAEQAASEVISGRFVGPIFYD